VRSAERGRARGTARRARLPDRARPANHLDAYVGQRDVSETCASRSRRPSRAAGARSLPVCRSARPGKTTLAHVITNELGAKLHLTRARRSITRASWPASDLAGRGRRPVHRRDPSPLAGGGGEPLPALETSASDLSSAMGRTPRRSACSCRASRLPGRDDADGPPVLAATRSLRLHWQLRYYDSDDLTRSCGVSAGLLDIGIDATGRRDRAPLAWDAADANRLLRRVRDFAKVEGSGRVDRAIAAHALERLQVDQEGLDTLDAATSGRHRAVRRRPGRHRGRSPPRSARSAARSGCGRAVLAPGRLHHAHAARPGGDPGGVQPPRSGRLDKAPTGGQGRLF